MKNIGTINKCQLKVMRFKKSSILLLIYLFQFCTTPEDKSLSKEDNSTVLKEDKKRFHNQDAVESTDKSATINIAGEEIELEDIEAGVETAVEITKSVLDVGHELVETKRRKDSIKLSRRERMFAYQLGVSVKNKKQLLRAYRKLSDKNNVYVLRKNLREYLLVRYVDKSKEDLDEELENYKVLHANEVLGEIKIVDLIQECGKRKKPRLTRRLGNRKNEVQLECLICR